LRRNALYPGLSFDGFAGKTGQPKGAWTTPLIYRGEMIVAKVGRLAGVDPATGRQPAISEKQIFIRGHKHLWCIGAPRTVTASK
jgi:hypothetical protein